jgi:hypothetical protein
LSVPWASTPECLLGALEAVPRSTLPPTPPSPKPPRPEKVRLWRVKRSQADILRSMRLASGLEGHPDLVAYWKFNDPDGDEGAFRSHAVGVWGGVFWGVFWGSLGVFGCCLRGLPAS